MKIIHRLLLLSLTLPGLAYQNDSLFFKSLIEQFDARKPLAMSFDGADKLSFTTQDRFVAHLQASLGKPVGYKAALTAEKARKRFGTDEPILGVLLEKMLLQSGAKVPVHFGSIGLLEGDLMVRVASDEINKAPDREGVLQHLESIIPFIEMPDLVYAPGTILNAEAIRAVNCGARLGVMGKEIPVVASPELVDKLGKIRLEILDSHQKVVGIGYTRNLMGHPLDVVMWVRDYLRVHGKQLQKGDLISLGSATSMLQVRNAETYTLTYYGMPELEANPVTVTFVAGEDGAGD